MRVEHLRLVQQIHGRNMLLMQRGRAREVLGHCIPLANCAAR
jgi:hypothetical protein